jgi:phage FluMu gp28-like protein
MSYFLPFQARWIADDSPLKLYEKTRRGGITYATSYRCVQKCLREKKDSSFTQWVSSRDELTAKEFVTDYVAMWAKEANKIAREMAKGFEGVVGLDGENFEVVDEKHGITARVVRFKNGARIVSLSSNPLAFAGKGGDVLIDEWDLHEDQAAVYDMAYPCITWGGQLELVSAYSATGTEDTEFARMCDDVREGKRRNVSFHRTTIIDAIEDGFVEKVNEVKAKRGIPPQTREEFLEALRDGCRTRDAFNSQYMCIPNKASGTSLVSKVDLAASKSAFDILRIHLDGDGSELDVVDPCCKPYIDVEYWRSVFGGCGRLELGWDIAVTGDLASIFVNNPVETRKKLLINITFKRCKLESQRQIIESMFDAASRMVGCGDKSGIGYSDCVKLKVKYPERFEGIVFSGTNKLVVMTCMQGAFERHAQMLPLDFPEISADIAAMKTGKTPQNRLTFIHGTNDYLPESHCDIAVSCGLANYAGEQIDFEGNADALDISDNSRYGHNDDYGHDDDYGHVPFNERF